MWTYSCFYCDFYLRGLCFFGAFRDIVSRLAAALLGCHWSQVRYVMLGGLHHKMEEEQMSLQGESWSQTGRVPQPEQRLCSRNKRPPPPTSPPPLLLLLPSSSASSSSAAFCAFFFFQLESLFCQRKQKKSANWGHILSWVLSRLSFSSMNYHIYLCACLFVY